MCDAEVADVGLGSLAEINMLVSCPDSALARVECAYTAYRLAIPMLDGGVQPDGLDEGRTTWFGQAPAAACYLCGFSEQRRADMLTFTASRIQPCTPVLEAARMTGTPATVRAVAAAMVKLLAENAANPGAETCARRITAAEGCTERVELMQNPSCPWHLPPGPQSRNTLAADETFGQALRRLDATGTSSLEMPWPISLTATCGACRTLCQPKRRVAWVKRRAACPGCGRIGTLEPQRILTDIRSDDDAARLTPRQLGLPDSEWYSVRRAVFAQGPGGGKR